MAQTVKNLPAMQETWVQSLGQEDPRKRGMEIHSSTLAWRIPWTEEHFAMFMELQRVRHNWKANTGDLDGEETACNVGDPGLIPGLGRSPGEENGYPLQYSCLDRGKNSMDRGNWWATLNGIAKNGTRLTKTHTHTHLFNTLYCYRVQVQLTCHKTGQWILEMRC